MAFSADLARPFMNDRGCKSCNFSSKISLFRDFVLKAPGAPPHTHPPNKQAFKISNFKLLGKKNWRRGGKWRDVWEGGKPRV